MTNGQMTSFITSFLFVFSLVGILNAQFIIEETVYEIPVGFDLMPEDSDFSTSEEEAEYYLNLPEEKLKSSDMVTGVELETERSTYFFDGKNIAVETITPDFGKTTTVINTDENKFYYITWSKKNVMEVTPEALKAMQQLAPEMSDEGDTGEEHGMAGEGKFQETGKTASIRGFECKQYIKKDHDQITMIWASADESGVTDVMTDAMNKMQSLDPENGDRSEDTWNVLKGMVPVEVRSIQTDLDSDVPEIRIRSITKIKKTTPDADMFRIPGPSEGFKQTSMEDYLK